MATINTAESYDLPFGRVELGAPADLVLLEDLDSWRVDDVLIDGELNPTADGTTSATNIPTDTVEYPRSRRPTSRSRLPTAAVAPLVSVSSTPSAASRPNP